MGRLDARQDLLGLVVGGSPEVVSAGGEVDVRATKLVQGGACTLGGRGLSLGARMQRCRTRAEHEGDRSDPRGDPHRRVRLPSGPRYSDRRRLRWMMWAFAGAVLSSACSSDPPESGWEALDRSERMVFMNDTVTPVMRELFQGHDPVAYADFGCETCHGGDMVAVDYRMPNALMPLPIEGTLETAQARDPEATLFMLEEVFPVMADLLDRDRYHPSSAPDGFRCVGCHLVADE
jgi:hypothetical protein